MEIKEFERRRLEYQKRALARDSERRSIGVGVDDTPYWNKVVEEMIIDLIERVEAIEELYKPAPETVNDDKPRKPRFLPTE